MPLRGGLRRRLTTRLVLALTLLAVLAFAPSLRAGFVFDDIPLIVDNDFIHQSQHLLRPFTTHLWDVSRVSGGEDELGAVGEVHRYYRPLVTLSYHINWLLHPGVAWPFHLVNVALHAGAVALATLLVLRLTRSFSLTALVVVPFAVHPTRVEVVSWISGRTDLLMMPAVLGALLLFGRAARAESRRRWQAGGLGLALMIVGVLSKEPAALLPVGLLAVLPRGGWRTPLFLVPACLAATYLVGRAVFYPVEPPDMLKTPTPLHALMTLGSYASRVVWPWPPSMYYQCLEFVSGRAHYPGWLVALGSVVLLGGLAAIALAWRRREHRAAWLLLAAVAFLGPLLNVYFTGMNVSAQDRFLYAPLLFAAAGLAVLGRRPLRRLLRARAARLAAAGVVLGWVGLVVIRTADYRDDATFWASELSFNPDNPYILAHNARVRAGEGDVAGAYELFSRALSPEAARFALFLRSSFLARTHYQRVMLKAALLPDGRARELDELAREFERVLDTGTVLPHRQVEDLPLGLPFSRRTLDSLKENRAGLYQGEGALIATRVGRMDLGRALLAESTPLRDALSSSPLNVALAHARVGDTATALRLLSLLDQRSREGRPAPPDAAIQETRARIERASTLAARAGDGAVGEAHRLAELGAYLAALRVLATLPELPASEAPFLTQLLLFARLDEAALAVATRALGATEATRVLAAWRQALPPALARQAPVPGSDWRAAVAR